MSNKKVIRFKKDRRTLWLYAIKSGVLWIIGPLESGMQKKTNVLAQKL